MLRMIAIATTAVLASMLPARAFTDPATGLGIIPPAPFAVVPLAAPAGIEAVIGIKPTTGVPAAADASGIACTAVYKLAVQKNRYTQAELNETVVNPDVIRLMKASAQIGYDVQDPVIVEQAGVKGSEFAGALKIGPLAGKITG